MRNPSSRFSVSPLASKGNLSRSIFDRDHDVKMTLSAGKLYPIYVDEYLPGDTFSLDTSFVCRMSTPIHPVMDNCFMDIYYFSVPYRLCWDHWKEFMGESPEDPYVNPVEYSIPQLKADPNVEFNEVVAKSVMDYMGIPAGVTVKGVSALPFRAFSIIWNEYFRDQNLQNAIDVDTSDNDAYYVNPTVYDADLYVESTAYGGALPPVNKYHDYFTSALLEPQKGEAVPIPLPSMSPVYASDEASLDGFNGIFTGSQLQIAQPYSSGGYPAFGENGLLYSSDDGFVYNAEDDPSFGLSGTKITPLNLIADTKSGDAFSKKFGYLGATINDLRYAFQVQKLLEADNRYGTRYTEIIKGHFGVTAPNGLLQRPEFLGGKRVRININQVLQTSATNEVSPQGNTAAYSVTSDRDASFVKSFTEHGVIIGVACIRNENTYQQGIEKFWLRNERFDFYFPELANISEQPIEIQELYNPQGKAASLTFNPHKIFGYQEAFADYRYKPNRVAGEFRSTYSQSLDVWHYADFYESEPVLSDEWIRADRANIDRTLAVSSDVADQFIADFYFKIKATRPMPMYSIPGLSDHH